MAASRIDAPDPMEAVYRARQPGAAFDGFLEAQIDAMVARV